MVARKRRGSKVKRRGVRAAGKPVNRRGPKKRPPRKAGVSNSGRARARKTHTSPQRYNQLAEGAYDFSAQLRDDRTLTASDRGGVRSLSIHSGRGRRRR